MTTRSFSLTGNAATVAVCAQIVLMFALSTLPTPLYRDYAQVYHFSIVTLTFVYATYVAGTMSTLVLFGRLSDQIGRKRVSLAAFAFAILAALMFIWIHNVAMLFAARFITGVAAALSAGAAVAWLREHNPGADAQRAGVLIVAMNVLGLGVGPLLTGLMAPADTQPLVLPYVAFIALALPLAIIIAFTRETVEDRIPVFKAELIHPIGVPRDLRVAFLAPGVTTFVIYSMVGFYSAIAPGLIVRVLHISGYTATGTIVFELFAAATLTVFVGQRFSDRTAMISGAAFMLPALACLVMAEITASLPALLAGTALGGVALGFGWRGALHLTAEIAPEHQRSEMVSMLFVCGNFGMTLPVIGIGVMETLTYPQLSILVFSGVIAVISAAGVVFGVRNHAEEIA